MAPDGTSLNGRSTVAVKEGRLDQGNGTYGPGNVCLFGGNSMGS